MRGALGKFEGFAFFVARLWFHAKAQRRKGLRALCGFAALRDIFCDGLRRDFENEKAMRGKGSMALDFAPFAGITRIRFKGFALARVSASRLPCVWICAEHRVQWKRVKVRSRRQRGLSNSGIHLHPSARAGKPRLQNALTF